MALLEIKVRGRGPQGLEVGCGRRSRKRGNVEIEERIKKTKRAGLGKRDGAVGTKLADELSGRIWVCAIREVINDGAAQDRSPREGPQ